MTQRVGLLTSFGFLMALGPRVVATTFSTQDNLTLRVDEADGAVAAVVVDGETVSTGRGGFAIADMAKPSEFHRLSGQMNADGVVAAAAVSFEVQAQYAASPRFIKVRVKVRNLAVGARGALVYFALPVDAVGGKWWDDQQTFRSIAEGKQYENTSGVRAFSGIAETRDVPALKIGMHSKTFVSAIATSAQGRKAAGLAFAHPLDELRLFRTGYDAQKREFYIVYELGLCQETRTPNEGEFSFLILRCDPQWGFRDALARYYAAFPQLFERRMKRHGIWMPFWDLARIDNANEFGFALQEGAPNVAYDDRLNVADFIYTTGGQLGANVKGYRPGLDPPPSRETVIAAFNEALKGYGASDLYEQVGVKNAEGELAFKPSIAYFQFDAQADMNPALPMGKAEVERIVGYFDYFRKRGGELDGVYYDGVAAGLDYTRNHFKYATFPPVFDPVTKKPVLYNYFSSLEFAQETASRLHALGKLTMMNGAMSSDFFCAPLLDVLGEETGLTIPRELFNYVRMMCYRKPFVTLLKGDYGKYTHADIELCMKRCLAFGVFPGFFDWYTSGLGPGSSYWEHPEWYERDRDLFRKHVPLVSRLAEAGWEPVTGAVANSDVSLERFGRLEDNNLHFTLLNESERPQHVVLSVPVGGLASKAVPRGTVAFDEISEQLARCAATPKGLEVTIAVPANDVALLRIGSKADLAADRVGAIRNLLNARKVQVAADAPKAARLVYWNAFGKHEMDTAERHSGTRSLRLAAIEKPERCGASQWVILHQKRPEKIHVNAWCKAANVSGAKDTSFAVRIVLHHVKDFITTTPKFLPLEPGAHDWQETSVDLVPEEPVDAVLLVPVMEGRTGVAWLDDVSLRSDASQASASAGVQSPPGDRMSALPHDGGFEQWHEVLLPQDAAEMAERLDALEKQAGASKIDLAAMFRHVDQTESWIRGRQLQAAAERELRDLADVRRHLTDIATIQLDIGGISIAASSTVTPGESFEARVTQEKAKPVGAKLVCEAPWRVTALKDGASFRVTVPATAKPGDRAVLRGEAVVGLPRGGALKLRATAAVAVVAPFEATLAKVGPMRLRVSVKNNAPSAKPFTVSVAPPTGGEAQPDRFARLIAGRGQEQLDFDLVMATEAQSGSYPASAKVTCGSNSLDLRAWVLYVPEKANRLGNAGFEAAELAPWSKYEAGATLDAQVFHTGTRSLRCDGENAKTSYGAAQSVALNQETPTPFLVRGFSKAASVSGSADDGYSIYVDCYYGDGTALYGQNLVFSAGTHDWEYRERLVEPAKPVRSVSLYAMFRYHTGTVWFDDLFLGEFVSRAGNLARGAKVTTDSCYAEYTVAPLTDGVTEVAGLDWRVADWASAEVAGDHWVQLDFSEPTKISRVDLYWSLDSGDAHASREYRVQCRDGTGWQDVVSQTDSRNTPLTSHRIAPVETTRLRILQPAGGGCVPRVNLMWVREVEVY